MECVEALESDIFLQQGSSPPGFSQDGVRVDHCNPVGLSWFMAHFGLGLSWPVSSSFSLLGFWFFWGI